MLRIGRREFLRATAATLAAWTAVRVPAGGAEPANRINLLFLMTDQQRFDAMSGAGNPTLRTPNLDRLAREGARFTRFYSSCPVCTPARAVILTGRSLESTTVRNNGDCARNDVPDLPTFDQILLRNGYRGEYHGKWHVPYKFALDYNRPVRWLNGKNAPPGCKAETSEAAAFAAYVAANVPARPPAQGELASKDGYYVPDPLDSRYGGTAAEKVSQAEMYGCLNVPPEHTHTAWTCKEGLESLDRLKDGPFTLTISIGPPHPPMIVAKPYYGMIPAASIPVPTSIDDPRTDSPYAEGRKEGKDSPYRDKDKIRQMASDYYGLVAEVDDWIGRILKRLDDLGLADRTLVIFTSDHGEMLGEHGLHGKGVFYEGAVHVPLLVRLPGVIPPGTVVQTPASHVDLCATILDYCGLSGPQSEGESLRPFIEGKRDGAGRIIVSEWANPAVPGFMVFDGRWKLLFGRTAKAPSVDALYDLKTDSHEMTNLLGSKGDVEKARPEAERLKAALVDWLAKRKSPLLEGVKARPIATQARRSRG